MSKTMVGRRVATVAEIERPGDYCGPIRGFTGDTVACWFLLPNARDHGCPPPQRSLRHVTFPPHTYHKCPNRSLKIRNSIGAMPYWHGFLDEGHIWREE